MVSQTKKALQSPSIEITACNLSEDLSRLASNNDELLLLIYEDAPKQIEPLFFEYFILDSLETKAKFSVPATLFQKEDVLLVLIEIDSEKEITIIEKEVSQQLEKLRAAYQDQDRIAQNKVLGDDDLLGIYTFSFIPNKALISFEVQGVHRADRYRYKIKISR